MKADKDKYFTKEEYQSIIREAYKYNMLFGLLFEFMGKGGLRVSEALHLKPEMIDFKDNIINIYTLKRKGHPEIPLLFPRNFMGILEKYIKEKNIQPDERVFSFSRQWVHYVLKKLLKNLSLSECKSTHAFRHFHGVTVSEVVKGDPIKIAQRLRHTSTQYVMRYTHLTDTIQKEISDALEGL